MNLPCVSAIKLSSTMYVCTFVWVWSMWKPDYNFGYCSLDTVQSLLRQGFLTAWNSLNWQCSKPYEPAFSASSACITIRPNPDQALQRLSHLHGPSGVSQRSLVRRLWPTDDKPLQEDFKDIWPSNWPTRNIYPVNKWSHCCGGCCYPPMPVWPPT